MLPGCSANMGSVRLLCHTVHVRPRSDCYPRPHPSDPLRALGGLLVWCRADNSCGGAAVRFELPRASGRSCPTYVVSGRSNSIVHTKPSPRNSRLTRAPGIALCMSVLPNPLVADLAALGPFVSFHSNARTRWWFRWFTAQVTLTRPFEVDNAPCFAA